MKGKITIDFESCKGCMYCVSSCPKDLIVVSDKLNEKGIYPAIIDCSVSDSSRKCTGCAMCAISCPDAVIEVYRETEK